MLYAWHIFPVLGHEALAERQRESELAEPHATRLCGGLHAAVRQNFVQECHQHRSSRRVAIYYQTDSTVVFDCAVQPFDDTVD
jgi:hypothetical protein